MLTSMCHASLFLLLFGDEIQQETVMFRHSWNQGTIISNSCHPLTIDAFLNSSEQEGAKCVFSHSK